MVVFGIQGSCIRISGCILAKVFVFWQNWLYSGKIVVFGQKGLYFGQSGCIRVQPLVVLGQSKTHLFGQ